jgi:hypothetical protein
VSENQLDYAQIRRTAEQEVKRQKRLSRLALFVTNLVISIIMALIICGLGTGFLSGTGPDATRGLLIVSLTGLFMSVLMHGLSLAIETRAGEQSMREHAVLQALQQQVLGTGADADDPGASEKPKRDQVMQLTDDGELIPEDTESLHAQSASRN